MRGATQAARRLKRLFRSLRAKLGKVDPLPTGDPITQMILGIFSRDVPESKAREALGRLRAMVVDYNELRVIPPIETAEVVSDLPNARLKCEDLSRALNRIFMKEHQVSLDRLAHLPRKEVVAYLEGIDGLDPYSRARVRLLGLNQHAVPLDAAMWAYARQTGIVHPSCSLAEAQAFLERRIPEGEALEFVTLLEKQAWAEMGAAVRSGKVESISSVPPKRTTRNLLRLAASGRPVGPAAASKTSAPSAEQGAATPTPRTAPARSKARSRETSRSKAASRRTAPAATESRSRSSSTARKSAACGTAKRSRQTGRRRAKAKSA